MQLMTSGRKRNCLDMTTRGDVRGMLSLTITKRNRKYVSKRNDNETKWKTPNKSIPKERGVGAVGWIVNCKRGTCLKKVKKHCFRERFQYIQPGISRLVDTNVFN